MKLFWVRITQPRVGRNPVTNDYMVAADSESNAIDAFDEEVGAHHREGCFVSITQWEGRVVRMAGGAA